MPNISSPFLEQLSTIGLPANSGYVRKGVGFYL